MYVNTFLLRARVLFNRSLAIRPSERIFILPPSPSYPGKDNRLDFKTIPDVLRPLPSSPASLVLPRRLFRVGERFR